MQAFDLAALLAAQDSQGQRYHEFIRSPDLSAGLYRIAAGGTDPQQPHTEDEVYYVIRGRGSIRVDDDVSSVAPGSLVFVAAGVDHRFQEIEETLEILVFWAPPHHSMEYGSA